MGVAFSGPINENHWTNFAFLINKRWSGANLSSILQFFKSKTMRSGCLLEEGHLLEEVWYLALFHLHP